MKSSAVFALFLRKKILRLIFICFSSIYFSLLKETKKKNHLNAVFVRNMISFVLKAETLQLYFAQFNFTESFATKQFRSLIENKINRWIFDLMKKYWNSVCAKWEENPSEWIIHWPKSSTVFAVCGMKNEKILFLENEKYKKDLLLALHNTQENQIAFIGFSKSSQDLSSWDSCGITSSSRQIRQKLIFNQSQLNHSQHCIIWSWLNHCFKCLLQDLCSFFALFRRTKRKSKWIK